MHITLHFVIPLIISGLFFRKKWQKAYLIMITTMLIDLDHLWATPIYDPLRCSIGFHPLHGLIPILFYGIIFFIPKLRLIGLGLLVHMLLDSIDCQFTNDIWYS